MSAQLKLDSDLTEIVPFIHTNKKVPDTRERQRKLLHKWESSRERLHAATVAEPEVINAWQLERISLLVDYAYRTHPFYNKLYRSVGFETGDIATWDDYNALPAITKQDIITNSESFAGANLSPSLTECYSSTTSGSSGNILTSRFDTAMIHQDTMQVMRYLEQMLGGRRQPQDLFYKIYVASSPFTSLLGQYPEFTLSNECPPQLVLRHLKRIRPAILAGFASYLDRLCELVTDPAELGIRAINTNSESSTEAQRRRISQILGAPVSDEYSSVEMGLIATQCCKGRYHLVEDNVRLDVVNPDSDGMGEVVLTSLINGFMPFIRYRQGDNVKVGSRLAPCPCGNRFRYLESFLGRTDQQLISRTIGNVPSDLIMSLYDRVLLVPGANLAGFQIAQKKLEEIVITVVPADKTRSVNQALVNTFASGMKELFQDIDLHIRVEERPEMPTERSHKRRLIKCEIKLF
jgi:phenylacetate-CoA ligase